MTEMDATATTEPARSRRGPDPVALLVGLLTLGMALAALVGKLPDLSGFDPRWLLAGGAAFVGLILLVGSLRGRRRT
ncbi:hypothetical protein ACQEVB_11845 [Pseudonocardia sp. CA-107938]|uniref:hypothetical protein n=1 Tax=Pseudonocardia sp. CA-107938 TaxID=3240021 RepID=UPI003D8BEFA0